MKTRSYKKLPLLLIVLMVIVLAWKFFPKTTTHSVETAKPTTQNIQKSVVPSLENVVESSLIGTQGTYGIVVKNFKTKEEYSQNEHRSFQAGSLYKLWVMATVFNQIQKDKLSADDILSREISALNDTFDISSQSAELTQGTITLSVKDSLEQMITISHNYAALLLTEKVKLSNIRTFLKENNFNESTVGETPKTSAYDVALFFEKLYKGELADSINTKLMLDLLKRQKLNGKLPQLLPEDTVIAHKTGEIDYLTHDAGIVFASRGDYIIAVLSESDYPPGAQERISKISKAVYDYFESK